MYHVQGHVPCTLGVVHHKQLAQDLSLINLELSYPELQNQQSEIEGVRVFQSCVFINHSYHGWS